MFCGEQEEELEMYKKMPENVALVRAARLDTPRGALQRGPRPAAIARRSSRAALSPARARRS